MAHYYNLPNNNNLNNALNFAIELRQTIANNQLPPHCNMLPIQPFQNGESAKYVIIAFTHPQTNHTGHVLLSLSNENEEGQIHIMCAIDRFNGFFNEINVNSYTEMYQVISFCQHILQFQPDNDNNVELNYIRIPNPLLDHWCVSPHMRHVNLNPSIINDYQ